MKLITKELRLVDIYPELAKVYAQKLHKKKEDIPFVYKSYSSEDLDLEKDVSKKDRTVISVISTSMRDRDGEVLLPKGMKVENYEESGKPVFWGHKYQEPHHVIGKNLWIKSDPLGEKVIAKTAFRQTAFSDEVYSLYTEDVAGTGPTLKGWSVGFIPIEWEDGDGKKAPYRTYNEWELLEYSAVPIPSNTGATTLAYQKGLFKSKRLKEDLEIEIEDDDQDVEIEFVVGDGVTKYFILLDNDEYQEISAEDIEAEEKEVEASDNDDTPLGDTMVKIEIPGLDELRAEIAALNERLEKLTTPIDDDPEIDIDPEEKDADIDVDIEDDTPPVPKSVTKEAVKEFIREKGIDVGKILEIALAKMKGKVSLDD